MKQIIVKTDLKEYPVLCLLVYENDTYKKLISRFLNKINLGCHCDKYDKIILSGSNTSLNAFNYSFSNVVNESSYKVKISSTL